MKKLLFSLLVALFAVGNTPAFAAAPVDVKSTPVRATIFPEGAQVTRSATAKVPAGRSELKFYDISPSIDLSTVRVKADGQALVMSVKHSMEARDADKIRSEIATIEKKIKELKPQTVENQLAQDVVAGKLESLLANRGVGSQGFSTTAGQQAYDYFSNRFETLKAEQNKYQLLADEIVAQRDRLTSTRDSLLGTKLVRTPCILVELEAASACTVKFEIDYLLNNVSWRPIYDMRAENLAAPMNLLMKAEIQQNSGEDWKDINLKLSTASPAENGYAPDLRTYYMDYGTRPPVYETERKSNSNSKVSGIVYDEHNDPLIGATVHITGTNIATMTGANGRFSFTLPRDSKSVELEVKYIGLRPQTIQNVRAGDDNLTIAMTKDFLEAQEVQVYSPSNTLQGQVSGYVVRTGRTTYSSNNGAPVYRESVINTEDIEKSVAKEIQISGLTTLLSSPTTSSINIKQFELPVKYTYLTVPRIENGAYLRAELYGLNNLGLLDGQANIFFENTLIGSSLIETQHLADTILMPMSREQNISVSRKLSKEIPYSQTVSGKLVQTRQWIYTIRNNRSVPITILLQDQIPVSENSEITVDVNASDQALIDANTGFVTWTLNLAPGATINPSLTYVVRSPRGKSVAID